MMSIQGTEERNQMKMITLDDLVPKDHLVRKIDAAIDFAFIYELVEDLYQLVRPVGYRACPDLSRYLVSMKARADTFSPGEKFIFKRLEGLVKICS